MSSTMTEAEESTSRVGLSLTIVVLLGWWQHCSSIGVELQAGAGWCTGAIKDCMV